MTAGRVDITGWWPIRRLIVIPLAFALVVTGFMPLAPMGFAAAQERPRTVIEMLFGRGTVAVPERQVRPRQQVRRSVKPRRSKPAAAKRSKSRSSSRQQAVAAAPAAVKKSDDAKTVLVVGDFLADAVADGLTEMVADNENVRIVEKANGSSGLVRDDHYDWLEKLGPMIDETKPAVVVVMLGSNDRQPISTPSGTLPLRSDAWTAEYQRRVEALAEIVEDKGVPLVWVGMPAFKFDRMSEDMVFFNDLYRRAAANVSGEFVDVWDGFVDANGVFSYSGPDVSGQPAQLRNSDGITMTDAGQEKLAFFAEKPIFRLLGNAAASSPLALAPGQMSNLHLPPIGNAANALVAPPVAMNDPALDGADRLLGGGVSRGFSLEPSPRDLLVVSGRPAKSVEGRADDFQWNSKSAAVSTDTAGPPIAFRGSVDLQSIELDGIQPPEEMPSLADAIIEEWSKEAEAAKSVPGAGMEEAPAADPSEPATAE